MIPAQDRARGVPRPKTTPLLYWRSRFHMPALCRLLLASGRQQVSLPASVIATALALGLALASPRSGKSVRPTTFIQRHPHSSSTT